MIKHFTKRKGRRPGTGKGCVVTAAAMIGLIYASAWSTGIGTAVWWLFRWPAPFPWLVLAALAATGLAIFLKIRFRRRSATIRSTSAPPTI